MTERVDAVRVVVAERTVAADPAVIFELITDPACQPRWDGNSNLAVAEAGQRVSTVGDVFTMTLTGGSIRENHVVEFVEGRLIAWCPAEPGRQPPGHLRRWQVEPACEGRVRVVHTYDWTPDRSKPRRTCPRHDPRPTSTVC